VAGPAHCSAGGWSGADARAGGVAQEGRKVIKVLTAEGKVIMRLPSTGGKVIKMLT
jgi:hypothetical protein